MPLPVPHLDDRDYAQLLADARALITSRAPGVDRPDARRSGRPPARAVRLPHRHLLYRLNRLPEKAYVAFLNLIGVTPRAAHAGRR